MEISTLLDFEKIKSCSHISCAHVSSVPHDIPWEQDPLGQEHQMMGKRSTLLLYGKLMRRPDVTPDVALL